MIGKGWIRGDWLGVIGIIIGLLGVAGSYYFYKLSEKEKEPILLIDPYRSVIVEAKSIKDFPLQVVGRDGRVLEKDITAVRFYFWNEGREPVRRADILKTIQVVFNDPDVEVIDYKILTSSREDIVRPKLSLTPGKNNSLDLSFDILELNDGFSAQILFAGPSVSGIDVKGTLEGVQEIQGNPKKSSFHFYKTFFKMFVVPLVTIVMGGVFAVLIIPWVVGLLGRTLEGFTVFGLNIKTVVAICFVAGLAVGVISSSYSIYTTEKYRVELMVISSMIGSVPDAVKTQPIGRK
ncbi:hypothetical protein C3E98_017280 [Pseudomonas sp. MWU13-2625]|nr:hypothetical protein C3E98_017280 [Pseudomonas sp. MWU13-2625]